MELGAYVNWFWARYCHRRKKSVARGELISPRGMETHFAEVSPSPCSSPKFPPQNCVYGRHSVDKTERRWWRRRL